MGSFQKKPSGLGPSPNLNLFRNPAGGAQTLCVGVYVCLGRGVMGMLFWVFCLFSNSPYVSKEVPGLISIILA